VTTFLDKKSLDKQICIEQCPFFRIWLIAWGLIAHGPVVGSLNPLLAGFSFWWTGRDYAANETAGEHTFVVLAKGSFVVSRNQHT
jgi:hypothetical protein